MPYVPHTPEDERTMLEAIGVETLDDLFAGVPEDVRLRRPLATPAQRTEAEILREFDRLAANNHRVDNRPSFLGAGIYHRFIPAAVDYLSSRGEFNTAYTPYQPEVSQGTLQAIFEYQTLICRLTGMEIANASMYEGATALAEAVLMSAAVRPKAKRVIVSAGLHPEYLKTLTTYLAHLDLEIVRLELEAGRTPATALADVLSDDTAAVAFQAPNFFGFLEDGASLRQAIDGRELRSPPFLVAVVDPISLGMLAPPGDYGADIAVGDGQQLGNYPSYGGPSFGFFATRQAHVRKIPGRIVGETTDRDGKPGYVLTFQTREQHIRRERATSNICTNQGLCSLRGAMYLSLMGEAGLREVAESSWRRAQYAMTELLRLPGVERVEDAPVLNEFPLRFPIPAQELYDRLGAAGIGGGLPLDRYFPERRHEMLFACTEMTQKADIDRLVRETAAILSSPTAPRGSSPSKSSTVKDKDGGKGAGSRSEGEHPEKTAPDTADRGLAPPTAGREEHGDPLGQHRDRSAQHRSVETS